MAATDRARKLLVRTAFVTTTTIATLVGAQNLAMLDAQQFLPADADTSQTMTTLSLTESSATSDVTLASSNTVIAKAAPSITILRQSGQQASVPQQTTTTSSSMNSTVIQPPSAQVAVPQTVVVQQPVRQRTRSSR